MREAGEAISAHHFEVWSRLDPEGRETWRRVFGDNEKRLGGPCACDAPAVLREEMGAAGLMKCSECCAIWDPSRQPKNVRILETRPQRRRRERDSPTFSAAEPIRAGQIREGEFAGGMYVDQANAETRERRRLFINAKTATAPLTWVGVARLDDKPIDCECAHPPPWSHAWAAWKRR